MGYTKIPHTGDTESLSVCAEFLKGATVRSRKVFQRLRKIWVFEHKNAQFTSILPFLGHLKIFLLVFGPFCSRKTFEQKYWLRNKNCF